MPAPGLAQEPQTAPSPAPPAVADAAGEGPPHGLASETPASAVVWGREIVTLRRSYGGRTPAERAHEIEERIALTLLADPGAPIRFQKASDGELHGMLVLAGPEILFGILEGDLPVGRTLEAEALAAAERLRGLAGAIESQSDARTMAWAIGRSLSAIVALIVFVWLLERRLRRFVLERSRTVSSQAARDRMASEKGAARFDGTFLKAAAVRTAVRSVLWFAELFAAFLCAQFVLRQFPYTQPLGDQLAGRILAFAASLGKILSALPDLAVVVIITLAARAIWNLVKRWTLSIEAGLIGGSWLDAETARPTRILLGIRHRRHRRGLCLPVHPRLELRGLQRGLGTPRRDGVAGRRQRHRPVDRRTRRSLLAQRSPR